MTLIIHHPTVLAQWKALLEEAQVKINLHVSSDLESYLINLLIQHTTQPNLGTACLGWNYLQACSSISPQADLKTVGDQCLLITGLFPQKAEKRNLPLHYFISLGQNAYATIAPFDQFYQKLTDHFIDLLDLLLSVYSERNQLDLSQAHHLWEHTRSKFAYQTLINSKMEKKIH